MKLSNSFLLHCRLCIATAVCLFAIQATAQEFPGISIRHSRLFSTYKMLKKLSEQSPDNAYKQEFLKSVYNQEKYTTGIRQFDTLNISYYYKFEGYPDGQKLPLLSEMLIEKNLINSNTIAEFKQKTIGIIPSNELGLLAKTIEIFLPVYDELVYLPNKSGFDKQLASLQAYIDSNQLGQYFNAGLAFYHSNWDASIPFEIVIVPSIEKDGFTATAFMNEAVSELPTGFKSYDVLFSVLLHEIFHILYDEQSLAFKQEIEQWFQSNPSKNSQYAYLLTNEMLATALGNGFTFEQLTGKPDPGEWYHNKYINQMAKKMYPLVRQYLLSGKAMDKAFTDAYIAAYDQYFSSWPDEPAHILTYRYILSENYADGDFLRKRYNYISSYQIEYPISAEGLAQQKESPVTKVIIVSKAHKDRLLLIKRTFPELNSWKYNPAEEFIHVVTTADKTKLIIINQQQTPLNDLFEKYLRDGKLVEAK